MQAQKAERSDYYVYMWRRPDGTPFYIGKGRRRRSGSMDSRNPIFVNIVEKIRREGGEPRVEYVERGLTERQAFDLEVALVAKFGRIKDGGVLSNLTAGGDGTSGLIHTQEQRAKNRDAKMMLPPSDGGYKGARFSKQKGRWIAKIRIDGKATYIGTYFTAEEAARAYDKVAFENYGEACFLNFPESVNDNAPQSISPSLAMRLAGPLKGKYKGVTKAGSKWEARIKLETGSKCLGRHDSEEEAAKAYDCAAYTAFGDKCYLNFPEDIDKFVERT